MKNLLFSKKTNLILLFFLLSIFSLGQTKEIKTVDSIRYNFRYKPSFQLGFDNRNSFIKEYPIKLRGLRAGWYYNKKIGIYTGYYMMNEKLVSKEYQGYYVILGLNYVSSTVEFNIFENNQWQISIPFQAGIGYGTRSLYRDTTLISTRKPSILPVEAGVNVLYKPVSWGGILGGIGVRRSLLKNHEFDGVYYNFGPVIFLGKIVRKVFPPKKNIENHPEWGTF